MSSNREQPADPRAPGQYKAQEGTWELRAPDGTSWHESSPMACLRAEMRDRIPASVAIARILDPAHDEPVEAAPKAEPPWPQEWKRTPGEDVHDSAYRNGWNACLDRCREMQAQRPAEPAPDPIPAVRAALRELDARLRECFGQPISAEEAYDSFYQEIVADALAAMNEPRPEEKS